MYILKFIQWVGVISLLSMSLVVPNASAQHKHDDSHEHSAAEVTHEAESDTAINTMCPVTTDEEVDPAFTMEYEGQTIGFCCRKCRTRFGENPEAYLSELPTLQAVSLVSQSMPSHSDGHGYGEESADEESQGHDEGEAHDHATDHGQGTSSGFSKLIAWIGKFHPPATHLPIGMLIGAALAEGLFIRTKRDLFRDAGAFCLVIAGLGAMGAVMLGWFNGGFTFVDDQWIQTVHRWFGTSTAILTLLSIALLIRVSKPDAKPSARLAYRASLFAAAGMVGATGFFGGALVYGINHYAW